MPRNIADTYLYPEVNQTTLDAFGRLRVSQPTTIFDSKQIYDNQPLFWDDAQVSGGGTTTNYVQARASTTIGVTLNTAGRRVRQTKRRFNYQPGKGQVVEMTAVPGLGVAGVTKRVGYFDDANGVFFQIDATGVAVGVRSSVSGTPVDTLVYSSSWNVDKMDGTGNSRIALDLSKSQIFYIDLEWLGVGSVRYGFVTNGALNIVHRADNANNLASVYMSTPNLPLRYEIIASGTNGADTLEHICATVQSDGGFDPVGVTRGIDRGVTLFNTGTNTSVCPLLSLRLKATHLSATVVPIALSAISTTNITFRWSLILNPTVAGVDTASWTAIANSALEFDISRTNVNALTGGTVLASGYSSETNDEINIPFEPTLLLGATIAGVQDQLVFAVQNITGTAESYLGSITVRELL